MPEVIYQGDLPAFTGRNVPIKEIASAIGKDAQYVRLGIQQGLLKFGTAIKVGSSNEFSYSRDNLSVAGQTISNSILQPSQEILWEGFCII